MLRPSVALSCARPYPRSGVGAAGQGWTPLRLPTLVSAVPRSPQGGRVGRRALRLDSELWLRTQSSHMPGVASCSLGGPSVPVCRRGFCSNVRPPCFGVP